MLNQLGDTTISWSDDRDDEVEKIIAKKMAEGCTFFIVDKASGLRKKLARASDAFKHRTLAIPDEDWRAFVGEGNAELIVDAPGATKPKTVRKAKTPKEVASSDTVGVRPRAGG